VLWTKRKLPDNPGKCVMHNLRDATNILCCESLFIKQSVEHLWEYIRENYFKNACWLSMETLEIALTAIRKKVTDCVEMIMSLVGFHWTIV